MKKYQYHQSSQKPDKAAALNHCNPNTKRQQPWGCDYGLPNIVTGAPKSAKTAPFFIGIPRDSDTTLEGAPMD